jgi:hypothetical protein
VGTLTPAVVASFTAGLTKQRRLQLPDRAVGRLRQ